MKNISGFRLRDTTDGRPSRLVVPVVHFFCFALILLAFGGEMGMQLAGSDPASWQSIAFAVACVVGSGFLLFRKARWLHPN